mmetsp:Transcript_54913/g.91471  ORF Transcript_54913/g.91471 Transcript_54913/m.91471 type:complete len:203 (+) Transcript_54913:1799-2407(+)
MTVYPCCITCAGMSAECILPERACRFVSKSASQNLLCTRFLLCAAGAVNSIQPRRVCGWWYASAQPCADCDVGLLSDSAFCCTIHALGPPFSVYPSPHRPRLLEWRIPTQTANTYVHPEVPTGILSLHGTSPFSLKSCEWLKVPNHADSLWVPTTTMPSNHLTLAATAFSARTCCWAPQRVSCRCQAPQPTGQHCAKKTIRR